MVCGKKYCVEKIKVNKSSLKILNFPFNIITKTYFNLCYTKMKTIFCVKKKKIKNVMTIWNFEIVSQ